MVVTLLLPIALARPLDWYVADGDTGAELSESLGQLWKDHEITIVLGDPVEAADGLRTAGTTLTLWLEGEERARAEAETMADQVVLARSWLREPRFADPNWMPEVVPVERVDVEAEVPAERPGGWFGTAWVSPGLRWSGQWSGEVGGQVGFTPRRIGVGVMLLADALEVPATVTGPGFFGRIGSQLAVTWWTRTDNDLGEWGIGLMGALGGKGVIAALPEREEEDVPVDPELLPTYAGYSGGHGTFSLGAQAFTPRVKPFPVALMIGGRLDFDFANAWDVVGYPRDVADANMSIGAVRLEIGLVAGRPWRRYAKP